MADSGEPIGDAAGHSFEELYEDAPCGYLTLRPDGTLVMANRTFLRSTGYSAEQVLGRRLPELMAPGSRLYHATHWGPKLELQGHVGEIPVDLVRSDGSQLAVLLNATLSRDEDGAPAQIRANLFDATDRRRYERQLITARDEERSGRERLERIGRISAALSEALTEEDVAEAVLGDVVELTGADYASMIRAGQQIGECRAAWPADAPLPAEPVVAALTVGDRTLGELRLGFTVPRTLTEEERSFLDTCADQCAQALARAHLFDEAQERAAQQAETARLGTRALEDIALPALMDEAARALCDTLDADAVVIAGEDQVELARRGRPQDDRAPTFVTPIGLGERRYGEVRLWAASLTPRRESFVAGVARVLLNSIERRRHEEATQHQATHDPVTDLPNRLLLRERLQHEAARARRDGTGFALCLLDVDDFKLINDTLGHAAGDDLLRAIAARLDGAMRTTDMLARLGGDEFVVLGPDLQTEEEARSLARRVADALRAPFPVQGSDLVVRASIGVVQGGGDSTADALLRDVDLAMYDAKSRGRGQQALFDASMRERLRNRVRVESELDEALRNGDLRVYYQPVVTAGERRISGVEALVRWQHPEGGLVPPDEFIPVAEATGQIIELGRFVMEEACRQLVTWRAEGLVDDAFHVAVNVSWRQLTRPGFPDDVAAVLARTGLDPARLGLEITETIAMDSTEHSGEVLAELAALGVELLLDDFGTGVSSLARLKRLPVDTLKIDRAFVRGVGDREDEDDAIVAAILAMADALGLEVVAEGVETEAQLARLDQLGCQLIQGFLFSRPVPADELAALVRTAAAGQHPAGLTAPADQAASGAT